MITSTTKPLLLLPCDHFYYYFFVPFLLFLLLLLPPILLPLLAKLLPLLATYRPTILRRYRLTSLLLLSRVLNRSRVLVAVVANIGDDEGSNSGRNGAKKK